MKLLSAFLLPFLLAGCSECLADFKPDYECLADSILTAENNDNYGVLTHYKHTSYRQACINTAKHAWKDYSKQVGIASLRASNSKIQYLKFLGQRYAPIGAKNDPNGLNRNWVSNVNFFYGKCTKQKEQAI